MVIKNGELLLGIRAREPSLGLFDIPGGFVDPGESLEQALCRELKEELGQAPTDFEYLTSANNTYPYRGVTYTTCDAFFLCHFDHPDTLRADDDIEALVWHDIPSLDLDRCAFSSTRWLVKFLQSQL